MNYERYRRVMYQKYYDPQRFRFEEEKERLKELIGDEKYEAKRDEELRRKIEKEV